MFHQNITAYSSVSSLKKKKRKYYFNSKTAICRFLVLLSFPAEIATEVFWAAQIL